MQKYAFLKLIICNQDIKSCVLSLKMLSAAAGVSEAGPDLSFVAKFCL